jgi:hypothetical protein
MKKPFIEYFREFEDRNWNFISSPKKAELVWKCAVREDLALSVTVSTTDSLRILANPVPRSDDPLPSEAQGSGGVGKLPVIKEQVNQTHHETQKSTVVLPS